MGGRRREPHRRGCGLWGWPEAGVEAHGSPHSPSTAPNLLRRIQQHRATIGERNHTGVSKTTPEQLNLFEALSLRSP